MKKKRRFQSFRTLLLRFHRYPCFTHAPDVIAARVDVTMVLVVAPAASGPRAWAGDGRRCTPAPASFAGGPPSPLSQMALLVVAEPEAPGPAPGATLLAALAPVAARGRLSMGDMAMEEKEADQERESRPPPIARVGGLEGEVAGAAAAVVGRE